MRSQISKALRKQFAEALVESGLPFTPDKHAGVPNGWRAFSWKLRSNFICYVILCIHPSEDNFTIECAWTTSGVFPSESGLQTPLDWPEHSLKQDRPQNGAFRFRLAQLFQPNDFWWWLVPEEIVRAKMDQFCDGVINKDVVATFDAIAPTPISRPIENIPRMVAASVKMISQYAVPYFQAQALELTGDGKGPIHEFGHF